MLWKRNKVIHCFNYQNSSLIPKKIQLILKHFSIIIKVLLCLDTFRSNSQKNKMNWLSTIYRCLILLFLLACLIFGVYFNYVVLFPGFHPMGLRFAGFIFIFEICYLFMPFYFTVFSLFFRPWKRLWDHINYIQDKLDLDQHFCLKFKKRVFIGIFILFLVSYGPVETTFRKLFLNKNKFT